MGLGGPFLKALWLHETFYAPKFANTGIINISRKEFSREYKIGIVNKGDRPLVITGFEPIFFTGSPINLNWGAPIDNNQNPGFKITPLVGFPFTVEPSNLGSEPIDGSRLFVIAEKTPVLSISFDSNISPLTEEQVLGEYNTVSAFIDFISEENLSDGIIDADLGYGNNTGNPSNLFYTRLAIQSSPRTAYRGWVPNSNIVYKKNIHGYFDTPKIKDETLWKNYAKKRITDTINPNSDFSIKRVTIADFLKTNNFVNNGVFNDDIPEVKRVPNRFKDPLPPYDFIWPYGDKYPFNGLRRTTDYQPNSRINWYYTRAREYFKWNVDKSLVLTADGVREIGGDFVNIREGQKRQRREWGFREKMLRGFPYFFPKSISPNSDFMQPGRNTPCGSGPIIAGFVTAGSGIFSGIPSSANISYDLIETQRTVNSPTDLPHTQPRVPTGLIFIQDETGAIGFSLGTDMRYMENPLFHNADFAESALVFDEMHVGSTGIPKADHRQFLREGDLVIIQVGVGFTYWHPVLGTEPRHWESLFGDGELTKLQRKKPAPSTVKEVKTVRLVSERVVTEGDSSNLRETVRDVLDVENVEIREPKIEQRLDSSKEHFIPPYVDNWGAGTNRPENTGMELAIEDVTQLIAKGRIEDFDAAALNDTSIENYVSQITATVNAAYEAGKSGALAGASVGGPVGFAIGAVVGALVGVATVTYIYNYGFYRERYVLRSRSLRDGQYPYTTFYPIQEYHPWSTGTPIPIDNGMPYIMSDGFTVDTRERFAPPPKEITAAQLRGIPEDTWRWDPKLEWEIPKKHLESMSGEWKETTDFSLGIPVRGFEYVENPNNPYKPNRENVREEFHGIKDEPVTPYTINPGSKYRGQLVKIKNVRFVKPPTYEYLVAKMATEQDRKLFEEDRNRVLNDLRVWLNQGKNIKDFKIKFADIPAIQLQLPQIVLEVTDVAEKILPTIQLAMSIMNTFFGSALKDLLGETGVQILSTALNEVEKYSVYVQSLKTKIEQIVNEGVSGFTSENQVLEFLSIKHGMDFNGMRFDRSIGDELYQLTHRTLGDVNLGDVLSRIGLAAVEIILSSLGLKFIGDMIHMVSSLIDTLKIAEVPEPNQYQTGYTGRNLAYETVVASATFPASVDGKNGGYWWADPSIPLTNARSHQNDANFGNPDTDGDNEGNDLYPNQDVSETERTVFTQLISSNKGTNRIPIFDPRNTAWVSEDRQDDLKDAYGKTHFYNVSYIKPRFVGDLGNRFTDPYEPFSEIWKPYRYIDGITRQLNSFELIDKGTRFVGDKVYYVVDEKNVVIPIRINANSEIARYFYEVPTGSIDLVGIAWQYSVGKPGLEWEREAYIMQVWPRYLSDVGLEYKEPPIEEPPQVGPRGPETPIVTPPPPPPPPPPTPPTRVGDITINIGDAIPLQNINALDCELITQVLSSNNNTIRRTGSTERLQGCDGLERGQEMYVIVQSDVWYGLSRTFYFRKDSDGNCTCLLVPSGTNLSSSRQV